MAADRQKEICQSQSLNIFLSSECFKTRTTRYTYDGMEKESKNSILFKK